MDEALEDRGSIQNQDVLVAPCEMFYTNGGSPSASKYGHIWGMQIMWGCRLLETCTLKLFYGQKCLGLGGRGYGGKNDPV